MIHFLATADLEQQISSLAIKTVAISAVLLIVFTLLAVIVNKAPETIQKYLKLPLFIGIAGVMAVSTLILAGSTVYLNVKSESGGPVHWHAGIEFWACGTEVNLRDPIGALSNKVGSSTYHEHNDKYIHLEGVVVEKRIDASLDKFMNVTGGYITNSSIGIPLSKDQAAWPVTGDQLDGDSDLSNIGAVATPDRIGYSLDDNGPVLQLNNGDACPDGSPGEVQVFVYTFNKDDKTYSQEKIEEPGSYIMRDESTLGPPGDCVIVEFDTPKSATDKICEQYGIKDVEKCTSFGVSEFDPGLCYIREVDKPAAYEQPTASNACMVDENGNAQECNDTPDSDVECNNSEDPICENTDKVEGAQN